jgi:hypothetical protein
MRTVLVCPCTLLETIVSAAGYHTGLSSWMCADGVGVGGGGAVLLLVSASTAFAKWRGQRPAAWQHTRPHHHQVTPCQPGSMCQSNKSTLVPKQHHQTLGEHCSTPEPVPDVAAPQHTRPSCKVCLQGGGRSCVEIKRDDAGARYSTLVEEEHVCDCAAVATVSPGALGTLGLLCVEIAGR